MEDKGLVLLSGGLDSATVAWVAKQECKELYALSFQYGQRHSREIECAMNLGMRLGLREHKILNLPLDRIGGSALVGTWEVPKEGLKEGIPNTWVPQRNMVFLALAFGWAEVLGCNKVYIGVNCVDYSGYPDCRPEFLRSAEGTLNLASKQFVENRIRIGIEAPLIYLPKNKIVQLGLKLGVPYEITTSCYSGGKKACSKCDSCLIRRKSFRDNGVEDPIEYEET